MRTAATGWRGDWGVCVCCAAGLSLSGVAQQVFRPVLTGAGEFVPLVQARHLGSVDYKEFLPQAQVASVCCWRVGLGSAYDTPAYVEVHSVILEGPDVVA